MKLLTTLKHVSDWPLSIIPGYSTYSGRRARRLARKMHRDGSTGAVINVRFAPVGSRNYRTDSDWLVVPMLLAKTEVHRFQMFRKRPFFLPLETGMSHTLTAFVSFDSPSISFELRQGDVILVSVRPLIWDAFHVVHRHGFMESTIYPSQGPLKTGPRSASDPKYSM